MGWLDWLFPRRCVGCDGVAPGVCDGCLARAPLAPPEIPPAGLDAWFVPFVYDGVVRAAVARVKYRNERTCVDRLAELCAAAVPVGADVAVTWLPTTASRRRRRGFDHAELLARAVARRRGVHSRRLLERVDHQPQTGRTRADRLDGPRFRAVGRPAPHVVLVDDVVTTGTSLRNAAATLRRQGCKTVIGVAVARTLLKPPSNGSENAIGRGVARTTIEPGAARHEDHRPRPRRT